MSSCQPSSAWLSLKFVGLCSRWHDGCVEAIATEALAIAFGVDLQQQNDERQSVRCCLLAVQRKQPFVRTIDPQCKAFPNRLPNQPDRLPTQPKNRAIWEGCHTCHTGIIRITQARARRHRRDTTPIQSTHSLAPIHLSHRPKHAPVGKTPPPRHCSHALLA